MSLQIGHDVPDLRGRLGVEGLRRRLGWRRLGWWGLHLPLVKKLPGPLDVGQQRGMGNEGEAGEVDQPGEEQVIEIGIDPGQAGGADP